MNASIVFLPLGLACLCVPTTWICPSDVRQRLASPMRRRREGLGPLLRTPNNWIDLVRAAAGAWMILRVFAPPASGQDELALIHLSAQALVIVLAAAAQTVWLNRPVRIVGPVFYLAGLTLAFSGPMTAGFALLLAFTCALLLGRVSLAFFFAPIGILVFGVLFKQPVIMSAVNAFIFFIPAFLAFASGQRLAFVRRPAMVRAARPAATAADFSSVAKIEEAKVIRPNFKLAAVSVRSSGSSIAIKPAKVGSGAPSIEAPRYKAALR
jgi:hypothetical protein